MKQKKRVAILISGKGSNMRALIAAARAENYPAEIALILSNKADAQGLAHTQNIPSTVINHKDYPDRESFDRAMQKELEKHRIDLVCLAGFMRLLSSWFVQQWEGRMLNIHPSLLPKYKGTGTHQRALHAGEKEHGCTVHLVTAELDSGPILAQQKVPVLPGDTAETLSARVLEQEHKLYPEALKQFVEKI